MRALQRAVQEREARLRADLLALRRESGRLRRAARRRAATPPAVSIAFVGGLLAGARSGGAAHRRRAGGEGEPRDGVAEAGGRGRRLLSLLTLGLTLMRYFQAGIQASRQ